MVSPLLVIAGLLLPLTAIADDGTTIYSMGHVEAWQRSSTMKLSISPPEDANTVPLSYDVIPLTTTLGLNQSDRARGAIHISGNMVSVTTSNYVNLTSPDTMAYLCCDDMSDSSNITPDMMMATLMNNRPKAILLYSTNGSCCGISSSSSPPYQTIFTMASSAEAGETLNWTAKGGGLIEATIQGNVSSPAQDTQDSQSGSNSAVAMSILYSITGLITLLFLVIIATGAIRAHRYPERYGPRAGYGGRARQSRAKGIARAVLETLPIVKFGDSNPPKPDPSVELERSSPQATHDPNLGTRLSAIPEEPQAQKQRQSELPTVPEAGTSPNTQAVAAPGDKTTTRGPDGGADPVGDEHLGCSICTEDFQVGEDVRVLPCDHKFHPACVDPWLMNVSGTCPLCRLDLRPPEEQDGTVTQDELLQVPLPPPLDSDGNETSGNGASSSQGRRSTRLLDLHRLRHASVEERMDYLRRHVSQPPQQGSSPDGDADERGHGPRLADRLRDKFRIHTRTQRGRDDAASSHS